MGPPQLKGFMRIKCNRAGGFNLFHVKLRSGINEIDDNDWAKMREKLDDKFMDALLTPIGSDPPQLELLDATPQMSAKEKIGMVEKADTLEALDAFSTDETRKTVIAAIEKRFIQLAEAER